VNAVDTEHARALLTRERDRVELALADIAETGVDEAVAETLRQELAAIGRAEERLAEGSYGLSVHSGDPIPDARLEAVPWAERTIDEQARYEHSG
jgi:DnaK suppressor protein